MDTRLDTLSSYGHTAVPDHDDGRVTHDALYGDDWIEDYDLRQYQTYFPGVTVGRADDITFVDRYPRSLRRNIHLFWKDGAVDMDEASAELPPHAEIAAEKELAHYVWDTDMRIFVSDDHNHALTAWTAAYHDDRLDGETTLLHIDQHPDMHDAPPELPDAPPASIEQSERFIGLALYIDEFIQQAREWGIVDEVVHWGIEEETPHDLEQLYDTVTAADTLILDIDLDVFPALQPDIDAGRYDTAEVLDAVTAAHQEAAITTVATSPGYVDQDDAAETLSRFYKRL